MYNQEGSKCDGAALPDLGYQYTIMLFLWSGGKCFWFLQKLCPPPPRQWRTLPRQRREQLSSLTQRETWLNPECLLPEGKLASVGNVTWAKMTNLPNKTFFFLVQSRLAALKHPATINEHLSAHNTKRSDMKYKSMWLPAGRKSPAHNLGCDEVFQTFILNTFFFFFFLAPLFRHLSQLKSIWAVLMNRTYCWRYYLSFCHAHRDGCASACECDLWRWG